MPRINFYQLDFLMSTACHSTDYVLLRTTVSPLVDLLNDFNFWGTILGLFDRLTPAVLQNLLTDSNILVLYEDGRPGLRWT